MTLDDEQLALLQLNLINGLGPRLQQLLLARFECAERIFRATGSELLQVNGIGGKLSAEITANRQLEQARVEWRNCQERDIRLRFCGRPDYPRSLMEIPDPPPVVYERGEFGEQDALAIGIVGSRHCTAYGRMQARKLAGALARAGMTVISGLARGIDSEAHRGALEAKGRTIAVCAPGLSRIYPPENQGLADEITLNGALISESPLSRAPNKGLFPQRNRIIAGLSLGVLIIEAGQGSGALHTARHAMEQGREVFAVPGRIDSPASAGCLDLLKDGATLVRHVDDILDSLGPLTASVKTADSGVVAAPRELNLSDQEREVLNEIDFAPTAIESVLGKIPIEASRVLSTLTVLEMKRLIRRLPGSYVERTGR
ncbi:MAG: DNA-processing protein DprA [Planctomycetaceae bacterium]|nr:DNA-processing protein DprA [Planctomycetaceae bacterium]